MTVEFDTEADTSVNTKSGTGTNYGDNDWLKVKNAIWYSMVKFSQSSATVEQYANLDAYWLDIKNLTLSLYTYRDISDIYIYWENHTAWDEDTLTYDDTWDDLATTEVGTAIDSVSEYEWVDIELDVDTLIDVMPIKQGKKVTFSIKALDSNANEAFYSSETDYGPKLTVTYKPEYGAYGSPVPTITPAPSYACIEVFFEVI